jgi:hypothetical protein
MTTLIGIIGAEPSGMSITIRLVEAGCRVTISDKKKIRASRSLEMQQEHLTMLISLLGDDYKAGVK